MTNTLTDLPQDLQQAHAMILAERAARTEVEVLLAAQKNALAEASATQALVVHLKLEIEKLKRELYGTRSERKARLLDQLEMQLEDAEAAASEELPSGEGRLAVTVWV